MDSLPGDLQVRQVQEMAHGWETWPSVVSRKRSSLGTVEIVRRDISTKARKRECLS